MSDRDVELHYDVQEFLLKHGTIVDILRLHAAEYKIPENTITEILTKLQELLNPDGGVPFDLLEGNPSSVKETAELIPLLVPLRNKIEDVIDRMVDFLVSRQKGDGGFAETLNLDLCIQDKWGDTEGREWYPVGKSVTWLTGKAIEALCAVDSQDDERLQKARDFLRYAQYEDGHWPDFDGQEVSDPLGTGNIIAGLKALGFNSTNKVYKDGRAALFQHLKSSIESTNTYNMVDLIAVSDPSNSQEKEVISQGVNLIISSQNEDGGWSPPGIKKSDPRVTSQLALALTRCIKN
jgi:hypothetical protein